MAYIDVDLVVRMIR